MRFLCGGGIRAVPSQVLKNIIKKLKSRKHSRNSKHYDKCAIDLNLFKPEEITRGYMDSTTTLENTKVIKWHYCTETSDHAELGAHWKSLDPRCTWGGDWPIGDSNHYSIGEFSRAHPNPERITTT